MVFLGYILPPKNQQIYNRDVLLALANYKKDLLTVEFDKLPVSEQQKIVDTVNKTTPEGQNVTANDLSKLLSEVKKMVSPSNSVMNELFRDTPVETSTEKKLTVRTTDSAGPTPINSPLETKPKAKSPEEMAISSAINSREQELKRPLTPEEKIDVENMVKNQGRLSRDISPASSAPTSPTTTILTVDSNTTLADLLDQINNLKNVSGIQKDFAVSQLQSKLIKDLIIRELKAGNKIYGARSGNQKNKLDENLLGLDKKNNIIFKNDQKPFLDKNLTTTLKINLNMIEQRALLGQGLLKTKKGVAKNNSEKNFGKYHISLPALRRNNLVIYRPNTNSTLISRRNMSPTLLKIINDIRDNMRFQLEDYDRLKKVEQKTVDHVINLLRMDYPPKMKRALDEENWNLKQRYEILLSEINAGNGGYMVVSELKDVLGKLLENKVINNRKYKMIMEALD